LGVIRPNLLAASEEQRKTAGPSGPFRPLTKYEFCVILKSMKVGERGQVTIPKDIRDRFSLGPNAEVEFTIQGGSIVLQKAHKKLDLQRWKGRCKNSLAEIGYTSVDGFIDGVRGR